MTAMLCMRTVTFNLRTLSLTATCYRATVKQMAPNAAHV